MARGKREAGGAWRAPPGTKGHAPHAVRVHSLTLTIHPEDTHCALGTRWRELANPRPRAAIKGGEKDRTGKSEGERKGGRAG